MRIALVAQSCDNRSGIGRVVLNLARVFHAKGNHVHVISQNAEDLNSGIRTHSVASFPLSNALDKLAFRLDATSLLSRFGVGIINAFGVGRGASIVTAGSCHIAGMEIRKTHRNELMWRTNFGFYDRLSLQEEKAMFTASGTKRIIAVSDLVKDQIHSYYDIAPEKIAVIPNGVDEQWFVAPTMRESCRKKLGIQQGDFILLFAGNEFDRKGLEIVIRSLQNVGKPARLIVVGGDNQKRYVDLASRLHVAERVTFVGVVPDPLEYFAAADVFAMPSLYEPFGMVIIEAMAAGIPVITSKACGAVEGMQHGVHGLYLNDPLSSEELIVSIRQLMDDRALARRMGETGSRKARDFVWSRIAERTLHEYRLVL